MRRGRSRQNRKLAGELAEEGLISGISVGGLAMEGEPARQGSERWPPTLLSRRLKPDGPRPRPARLAAF